MNIAFALESYLPHIGGTETRVNQLSRHLPDNWNIDIYSMNFEDSKDYNEDSSGARIIRLGNYSSKKYFKHDGRELKSSLEYARQLSASLRKNDDYDAVIFGEWNLFHFLMSKKYVPRNRIVDWCEVFTGSDYLSSNMVKKIGEEFLERRVAKSSDHNLAVNDGIGTLLNRKLSVPRERIEVIRNGVDDSILLGSIPSKNQKNLLYVGRIARHKQVDLLIKAFRKLEDTELVLNIVGDCTDIEYSRYVHEISHDDKRIRILGSIPYEDVIKLYTEAGFLVLPSLREGTGLVILEAFANFTPSITVRAPLNHSISDGLVEGYNGFVSENNIASLSNVLRRATSLPEDEFFKLCFNARESVSNRTWRKSSEKLRSFILKLVENGL